MSRGRTLLLVLSAAVFLLVAIALAVLAAGLGREIIDGFRDGLS